MATELHAITFRALDPAAQARFWAELLGWRRVDDAGDGLALEVGDAAYGDTAPDGGDRPAYRLRFVPSDRPKVTANRMHFDLTSGYPDEQAESVARAISLGAKHIDVGQTPEEGHTVLADPEGNEVDVLPAERGTFMKETGFTGALACDGSEAVGRFWSAALDWPLVWDQDEETAIQSPRGGTKINWGGPPYDPQARPNRLHFDLAPSAGSTLDREVERLLALGATMADEDAGVEPCAPGWAVMLDPDGTEFCVMPMGSA
jgi:catechol 2,3-dioxygenase-like lactoylglutathione lyase family enzyme